MSKNIRKNSAASIEQQIKNEDAELSRLDTRSHEFTHHDDTDENAPAGRANSVARQVSGPTVFDAIEDLSSVGQVTSYRSLANGALCGAVFALNELLGWTGPTEDNGQLGARGLIALSRYERLRPRIGQLVDLHNYAALQLAPLIGDSVFDAAMTLDEAIEFACNNAGMQQDTDRLPNEVLEALGLSAAEVAAIDAEDAVKRVAEGQKLRQSLRDNAEGIKAELENQIDLALGSEDVVTSFNAMQHRALLQKTQRKLSARLKQLVAQRNRYTGAIGDAMLISADVRAMDKAFVKFCRANVGELNEDTVDA